MSFKEQMSPQIIRFIPYIYLLLLLANVSLAQEEVPGETPKEVFREVATDAAKESGSVNTKAKGFKDLQVIYDKGKELLELLEYQQALVGLKKIETVEPQEDKAGREIIAAIYFLVGRCHLGLGEHQQAVAAFSNTLRFSPEMVLDEKMFSPKIVHTFNEARETMEDIFSPRIEHTPVPLGQAGEELKISAKIRDKSGVKEAMVKYRTKEEQKYQKKIMAKLDNNLFQAVIPGQQISPPLFSYYIVSIDNLDNVPALCGNQKQPFQVKVVPSSKGEKPIVKLEPIYNKWWFWSVVGVAALSSSIAAYMLLEKERSMGQGALFISIY